MKRTTVSILSIIIGGVASAGIIGKNEWDKRKKAEKTSGKLSTLFYMMNQWVKVKQDEKNLSAYFKKNGYKKIAIYGMSYVGEALLNELKGTEIEVAYGIDKRAVTIRADVDIVLPDDSLESVDAVVVTAIESFEEIKEKLERKMECPIISMEEIVFEV